MSLRSAKYVIYSTKLLKDIMDYKQAQLDNEKDYFLQDDPRLELQMKGPHLSAITSGLPSHATGSVVESILRDIVERVNSGQYQPGSEFTFKITVLPSVTEKKGNN
jgi:hypothetical protein